MTAPVLADALGPRGRRRVLVASIAASVVILAIVAVLGARLEDNGQLDAERWRPLTEWLVWRFLLVGLVNTVKAAGAAMLLALANVVLYALFQLMTRRLAAYDSPETIQYLPALGAAILLAPFAIARWESPQGPLEWTVACLMGAFGGLGHYLLAAAHRYAPATVLAPLLYQQVVYMALFGYLVFGDVPSAGVWLGAAIVIAAGLYLFARERARF